MKNFTKITALLLSLVLAMSCISICTFAADEEKYPVVYIKGQGSVLTDNAKSNGKVIYPIEIPDGYLGEEGKKLAAPLLLGLTANMWDSYNKRLYPAVMNILSPYALDENGEVTNGSGSMFSSSKNPLKSGGWSTLSVYYFDYDWRLDPVKCADDLHEYIQFVKTKSNTDKVNIIARCLGTNIVLAYANKYGTKDIQKCLLCCSGFDGFETIGALFSGEISCDSGALKRFSDSYLSVEDYADDPTFEIIRNVIAALGASPVLSFGSDTLNNFYAGIKNDSYREILRDSYATTPSTWSYVGDDYYEKAKEFVYGGCEEKYAKMIEKIDYFHYEILNNYSDILDKMESDGTYIYNVVKYGFQILPLLGDNKVMSDTLISTKRSSMGATCCEVGKSLSGEYLASADLKYVSPDNQIDASTCRYPEHTWFIKNMTHKNMPDSINMIFEAILQAEGYATVNDVEGYPQFLMSSDSGDEIFPATKENTAEPDERIATTPLNALIKILVNIIKRLLAVVFSK